ncbi:MAG TPA: hypothetical protein VG406_01315 [Isosphaeraceae bacterium]|jgi:hypothetical protein|nr:hypothetical protein [Isosphaeraceae bacterium]
MAETITLSDAALAVLRLYVERGGGVAGVSSSEPRSSVARPGSEPRTGVAGATPANRPA